jgi:hypothetical protein
MAFTGTAVVKQIKDNMVRITGLSLASNASGTIGLAGHTGSAPGVTLPASFNPQPYGYGGATVQLADSVKCDVVCAVASASTVAPQGVTKTGTTAADFLITIQNTQASISGALEFYITFHD